MIEMAPGKIMVKNLKGRDFSHEIHFKTRSGFGEVQNQERKDLSENHEKAAAACLSSSFVVFRHRENDLKMITNRVFLTYE